MTNLATKWLKLINNNNQFAIKHGETICRRTYDKLIIRNFSASSSQSQGQETECKITRRKAANGFIRKMVKIYDTNNGKLSADTTHRNTAGEEDARHPRTNVEKIWGSIPK